MSMVALPEIRVESSARREIRTEVGKAIFPDDVIGRKFYDGKARKTALF